MDNFMAYKGYKARIEYDGENDMLVGFVPTTSKEPIFKARSLVVLREDFESAIDELIDRNKLWQEITNGLNRKNKVFTRGLGVVKISSSYSDMHIATIVRVGLFLSFGSGFSVEDISV